MYDDLDQLWICKSEDIVREELDFTFREWLVLSVIDKGLIVGLPNLRRPLAHFPLIAKSQDAQPAPLCSALSDAMHPFWEEKTICAQVA